MRPPGALQDPRARGHESVSSKAACQDPRDLAERVGGEPEVGPGWLPDAIDREETSFVDVDDHGAVRRRMTQFQQGGVGVVAHRRTSGSPRVTDRVTG